MGKLREKFSNLLKNTSSETLKYVVIGIYIAVAFVAITWSALMTAIVNDLTKTVKESRRHIQELEIMNNDLNIEAIKYKQISEDLYDYVEKQQFQECNNNE